MFNSSLRKFIFEVASNYEFLFIQEAHGSEGRSDVKKILKNNDAFLKRLEGQLQDFPNALNILHPHKTLIDHYQSTEEAEEKSQILQKIVLELVKHVIPSPKKFRTLSKN